ncbi:flavin-dependent oxidoreductase [Pararhizobium sp. IMCC21322]|uniref:flavin-dependent oxidoreductase n=1 Tax=Pararhizobium sp. IMCC21322 TaxID=3067903 RepID=UPI002740B461|nr:flavin-dependent oxidoreductase [Pararhizobium sp. IMCC21322]
MTILIAGAGIAGLSLALTCHQLGLPVRIFERSQSIQALGVGINLQPNCVRELFDLGLERDLDGLGLRTSQVTYFTKYGQLIWGEPRGMAAGNNWPQYSVHRGNLQRLLFETVLERLGAEALVTDAFLLRCDQEEDGVTAHFRSAGGAQWQEGGSVLIGADGIHSALRGQFYPGEGSPIWGGAVLWRGTSIARPFLDGATMAMAGHEHQKFVTYPISKADPVTGMALINWIAELKFAPDQAWRKEDWNRTGNPADFLPAFESWSFDWLDAPALIRSAQEILEYPMVDRDPLPQWTFGRATLMGDAAHAMYPIGSNGASQAIIDARVLGLMLKQRGACEAALVAYEAERRAPTNAIVLANRGNGPDQIMELVEQRSKGKNVNPELVISNVELQDHAAHYKALTGLSIDALNARPPIIDPALAEVI